MKTYRKTAVAVGILFIFATALSLLDSALTKGVDHAADNLVQLAGRGDQFIAGALLAIGAGVCCVLIAALLFPILRQRNEGMALGYLGLRIMEAMTLVMTAVSVLLVVTLSRQAATAGTAAGSLRATAALLQGLHEWAFPLNPFVFGVGAVLFYTLLYTARLVPRWLSVWGLVGAGAVFAFALLKMYGGGTMLLAVPIGVQEMVLAGWLIARGFNVSALVNEAAPPAEANPARAARQVPVLDHSGAQA